MKCQNLNVILAVCTKIAMIRDVFILASGLQLHRYVQCILGRFLTFTEQYFLYLRFAKNKYLCIIFNFKHILYLKTHSG